MNELDIFIDGLVGSDPHIYLTRRILTPLNATFAGLERTFYGKNCGLGK